MNGLKTVTIGSLGNVVTGSTPPKKDKDNYGDYALWIKPTDINENEKYTRSTEEMFSKKSAEQCKSRIVPKDSICVPCIGTIGTKLTMSPCDCFVNQSINAIVPNENFDNHYVYYLLRNFLPSLKSHNKGTASGREFIAKTAFEEIEIKVFEDKHIQHKIGLILSEYDNLIDNYHRQIELLEEAAQRLYKEWFVYLRFPRYEYTKIVDGVPECWEKKSIGELLGKIKRTKQIPSSEMQKHGLYPVIDQGKQYIAGYTNDASAILYNENPIIVFGDHTRIMKLIPFPFAKGADGTQILLSNNLKRMPQSLFYYSLKNVDLSNYSYARHFKYLKTKIIFLPSDSIAQNFNANVFPVIKEIQKYREQIIFLMEARDRLLPKLMSGEIKV